MTDPAIDLSEQAVERMARPAQIAADGLLADGWTAHGSLLAGIVAALRALRSRLTDVDAERDAAEERNAQGSEALTQCRDLLRFNIECVVSLKEKLAAAEAERDAAREALANRLHAEIMNLPFDPGYERNGMGRSEVALMKVGHRDARHAAASLVLRAMAEASAIEPAAQTSTLQGDASGEASGFPQTVPQEADRG